MWWIIVTLIVGIGCFIAGMFVYRNNAKLFSKFFNQFKTLPLAAQKEINDVLKKYDITI